MTREVCSCRGDIMEGRFYLFSFWKFLKRNGLEFEKTKGVLFNGIFWKELQFNSLGVIVVESSTSRFHPYPFRCSPHASL